MRVVAAHAVLCGDGGSRFQSLPSRGGVPSVLFAVVFEVAVLQQFGAESSVGGTAYVLEEYADEPVGDAVRLPWIYLKPCGYAVAGRQFRIRFFQISLQFRLVMGQWAAVLPVLLGQFPVPCTDIVEVCGGNVEAVAFRKSAVNGGGVALPDDVVGRGFELILLECAEIPVGMHIAFALGCLQIYVERAVVRLVGSHIFYSLFLHDGIVLGSPCNQILRIGHGELPFTLQRARHVPSAALVTKGRYIFFPLPQGP